MIGTRVGSWLLEAEIGAGPMGTVYRARAIEANPEFPQLGAVKLLTHPQTQDAGFLARFPAEMLALRRLTHPNLARYFDSGVHAGIAYYAMEYVEGLNLSQVLMQKDRQPAGPGLNWRNDVFSIAVQVARALKHGHHRSLLHRDLKPANILLTADGQVKVTDFGVAKVYNLSPLTLPGDPFGTAGYTAPEHFRGKPLTRRSDLYALGGVLYTLVTGRPPFPASTAAELMHKHCYMLPDRPINFVTQLPHELDDLICSLLAKDPARRPASVASFIEDLDRLRAKLERKGERIVYPPDPGDPTGNHAALLTGPATNTSQASHREAVRGRLRQAAVLSVLLAIVVGIILYVFFRPRPSAEELWQAAQPLLKSEDPNDWDRANEEYLDAIRRWHPAAYQQEIQAERTRIYARKELLRVLVQSERLNYATEGERLYYRGLRLAQAGDYPQAEHTWKAMIMVFADDPANQRWVQLAEIAVGELQSRNLPAPDENAMHRNVQRVLNDITRLRQDGKEPIAKELQDALESLYLDQPVMLEMIRNHQARP